MLLIGVLGQEGDGRVGRSGLRLGEGFRVTGAWVAHDFSRIQLLRTPPGVLQEANTHDSGLSAVCCEDRRSSRLAELTED